MIAGTCTQRVWSQERFQKLYSPAIIQKYKIQTMTIELHAGLEGADTNNVAGRDPDYKERFYFDEKGRPSLYEATDIHMRNNGTPGPHLRSLYEYSDNGQVCHRHDSTSFGHSSEWQCTQDSLGRRLREDMYVPDEETAHIQRQYIYDARGRLQKLKSKRSRSSEGITDECVWVFYVHDNLSFNATSLSPMDMARCQCSLEYLDDQGRPARRVVYDSTGAIDQTILYNYDRTSKPIRMEVLDGEAKALHAWVDITYGRNGLVILQANGKEGTEGYVLGRLGMVAQEWIISNWADWRLLRELRVKLAGREASRFILSYQQSK
jgi:hypothetical protein